MRMPTDTGDLRVVEATSPPVDLTAPIVAVGRSTGQIPAGRPPTIEQVGAAACGGLPRAAAPRAGAPRRRRRRRRRDARRSCGSPRPPTAPCRDYTVNGLGTNNAIAGADRRRRRGRRGARLVRRPTLGRRARRRGRRLARRMGRPAHRPHRVADPRRAGRRGRAVRSGSTPCGPPARSASILLVASLARAEPRRPRRPRPVDRRPRRGVVRHRRRRTADPAGHRRLVGQLEHRLTRWGRSPTGVLHRARRAARPARRLRRRRVPARAPLGTRAGTRRHAVGRLVAASPTPPNRTPSPIGPGYANPGAGTNLSPHGVTVVGFALTGFFGLVAVVMALIDSER